MTRSTSQRSGREISAPDGCRSATTSNINVLGTILTVQAALERFGADGGSIINLSSIVGSHPVAGVLLYASTKGAIETLTRGLALELAPRKIRVNAISPGHTETEGNVAAGTFEGRPASGDTILRCGRFGLVCEKVMRLSTGIVDT